MVGRVHSTDKNECVHHICMQRMRAEASCYRHTLLRTSTETSAGPSSLVGFSEIQLTRPTKLSACPSSFQHLD